MKNKRQELILRLVEDNDIETQEELISRLNDAGYTVTQSTISRDIRALKLTKVTTAKGVYKYAAPRAFDSGVRFRNTLSDSILKVDWAMNQIVIKTLPGMAQALATAIDGIERPDVLGCVAGDDTIIVVTRSPEAAAEVAGGVRDFIRSLG